MLKEAREINMFQFLIGIINLAISGLYSGIYICVSIPYRYYKSLHLLQASIYPIQFQFLIGIINLGIW